MNYRFQTNESILIKGKRERSKEKSTKKKEKWIQERKLVLFHVNELHSFLPCISTQPKVEREDETNSTNSTLLPQLQIIG